MVRVVLGESGELAVDLGGSAFGRGAWLHPRTECIEQAAPRGLGRSFRSTVASSPAALVAAIVAAAERRIAGLLSSARAAGKVCAGTDAVADAVERGTARVVVVAADARATAQTGAVHAAAARGIAMTWGSKVALGRALSRPDTAVVAITDKGFAEALSRAIALSSMAPARGTDRQLPHPGSSAERTLRVPDASAEVG